MEAVVYEEAAADTNMDNNLLLGESKRLIQVTERHVDSDKRQRKEFNRYKA